MQKRRDAILISNVDTIPLDKWNTSNAGDLLMATHKMINLDTRSDLYNFIGSHHITDKNLYMLKPTGDDLFSFTPEIEGYYISFINENPHNTVKASLLYDLVQGFFTVSQSIRTAELSGKNLADYYEDLGMDFSNTENLHAQNISHWSSFTADKLEEKSRNYANLAKESFKKERLYKCSFDAKGKLYRKLITTLGRKIDSVLYKMENFCIGKPVKNEFFTTLEGKTVELLHRAGKIALIDIWSTTCSPCKRKLPDLMELQRKLAGKPLEILTLNVDKERETLDAFLEKPEFIYISDDKARNNLDDYLLPYINNPKVTLPVAHIGLVSPLLKKWDITGYPTLILLDQDGIMHWRGHDIPYDIIDTLINQ